METGFEWIQQYGYPAIFVLLMLGIVGLPIPDETLLVFAGFLSYKGHLSLPYTVGSALLGSLCGITMSYSLGRLVGPQVMTSIGPWIHLTEERLKATQAWIQHWGKYALIVTYFIPGLRHLGALAAGASRLAFPSFATYASLGALLWSGTFVGVGYVLGEEWATFSVPIHQTFTWIALGALFALGSIILIMFRRPLRKS